VLDLLHTWDWPATREASVRDFILFLHILAAGTWLGANIAQLVVNPVMGRIGGAPAAAWMRQTVRMGLVLYAPTALIALLTGIYLVVDSPNWEFEQPFVVLGFVTVIVGGVIGSRIIGPLGRKVAELYESGDTPTAAIVGRKLGLWGYADTALIVFTIYAMVEKLGVG
jgi:uncharacterized membrane protein